MQSVHLIQEDKQPLAKDIIDRLAFMKQLLNELQDEINTKGAIVEFKQGKQQFDKANPALDSYGKMIAKYNGLISQLVKLYPKHTAEDIEVDPRAELLASMMIDD